MPHYFTNMSIYTSHLHVIYCIYHIYDVMATLTKEPPAVVLKAETLAETQDLRRRPSASWKHVTCMGLKPLHYLRTDPGRPSRGERRRMDGWKTTFNGFHTSNIMLFLFLSSTRAYCTVPQDCNGSTTVLKNMLSNQNHQNLSGPVELLVHWFGLRESGRPSWVSQSQSEGRELTNRSLDLRWAGQTSNASLKSHWWREAKRGRWRARCQTVIARDDTDGNGPRRPCPYLQLSRTPCLAGCLLGLQFHMFIYRYIYIYKYPHIRKWIWHWRQKAHS